jgi:6-phosphogluconolactonase
MLRDNWTIYADIDKLSKHLAYDILSIAEKSINLSDNFKIVLAGGTSLISTYKIFKKSYSDWDKWHIYIGDERCLPLEDDKRNDYIIKKVWLKNSPIPRENINFIHAELGADCGALYYEKILEKVGYFDLVLLGAGEDGHSASLFPGHSHDDKDVIAEYNSPKYPKNRISMSYSRLNRSKNVFKIICGKSKSNMVNLWLNGEILPINSINGNNEKVYLTEDIFY